MNRQQYIEWYKDHYGHMPPPKLLDKYYPIEQKGKTSESTPEELELREEKES